MNEIRTIKTEDGWEISLNNETVKCAKEADVLDQVCIMMTKLTPYRMAKSKMRVVDV